MKVFKVIFLSQVDMKDLQAASMAMPPPGSKDSAFKVKIDVKDLEKVEKSHYIAGSELLIYLRTGM